MIVFEKRIVLLFLVGPSAFAGGGASRFLENPSCAVQKTRVSPVQGGLKSVTDVAKGVLDSSTFAEKSASSASKITLDKVDKEGNYLKFRGVTIVSDVRNEGEDDKLWNLIYLGLSQSKLINQYYALLPRSSYHMTTLNLYNEAEDAENDAQKWESLIKKNLGSFKSIRQHLSDETFGSHGSRDLNGTIKTPRLRGALVLTLKLPKDQEKRLRQFGQDQGLSQKVPPTFHVSLAYAKQPQLSIDEKVKKEIQAEVSKIVEDALKAAKDGKNEVSFQEPRLTTFQDMTAFDSWEEDKDPSMSRVWGKPVNIPSGN